jgi:multisubunit Na+/H+ antiporter MnhC subunit
MSTDRPQGSDDMSAGGFLARIVSGFVLDAATNGAVFVSLIVLIAGFVTKQPAWIALGVVVGLAGMALPWTGLARKWSDPVMWAVALPVIVIDLAVLALMWKRA